MADPPLPAPSRVRDVPAWIARTRELPFDERIDRASAAFLGVKFQDDAVGEGRSGAFDRRPAFRFDRLDCRTYIEVALALASARSGREFREIVLKLRYLGGKVDFGARHHLMVQWITHNLAAGLFRDVTADVAGDMPTQSRRAKFDLGAWFGRLGPERLHGFQDGSLERGERLARLRRAFAGPRFVEGVSCWLPLSSLVRAGQTFPGGRKVRGLQVNTPALDRIPSGAVIPISSPTWSHMGLAVRHGGKLLMRHASHNRGEVLELDLLAMLMTMERFNLADSIMVLAWGKV
jgi:hypothetical protein